MFFQEKRALASLIGTTIVSVLYFVYIMQRYEADHLGAATDFSFWGAAILIFIPVSVVFKIAIHIIFIIINTVTTQEQEPSITDEFDKQVELKALQNFCLVFMAGFLLAMALVAFGLPTVVMFIVLLLAMFVAGIILDASEFYFYRRGV